MLSTQAGITDSGTLNATGLSTLAGGLTLNSGDLALNGNASHITVSQSTPPSTTVFGAAGSGATCTLPAGSTDTAGMIILTTGTAPSTGLQCGVNYETQFVDTTFVVMTPADGDAVNSSTYVGDGTTLFNIWSSAALIASTTYAWNYVVVE